MFKDYANNQTTKDLAIQKLVDDNVSNEKGASIRIGNAKIIFSEKGNCEALMIVQNSHRLSEEIINSAKKISKEDCDKD